MIASGCMIAVQQKAVHPVLQDPAATLLMRLHCLQAHTSQLRTQEDCREKYWRVQEPPSFGGAQSLIRSATACYSKAALSPPLGN
jgi:hypothetical protein